MPNVALFFRQEIGDSNYSAQPAEGDDDEHAIQSMPSSKGKAWHVWVLRMDAFAFQ